MIPSYLRAPSDLFRVDPELLRIMDYVAFGIIDFLEAIQVDIDRVQEIP
jgi:hypothetical protein